MQTSSEPQEATSTELDSVSIIPLGGLGEFGKNMMVYEFGQDIVIVDAGIMFPEHHTPGIDLIVNNIEYLVEHRNKIRGVVITHAHEDHMGGLSFLLREINIPVYATKLTLALASGRLKEYHLLSQAELHTIDTDTPLELGCFNIEFINVTHSVPDAVTLAIHTPVGTIVHTSDFKFDQTPIDNRPTDLHKLAAIGAKGVRLLLSDSTNVDRSGFSPSERSIFEKLDQIFRQTENRLFLCTFSSSLHRIQQFIDLAVSHRRLVAITGRSMISNIRTASELGYLNLPPHLLIDIKDVERFAPNEVLVLSTGSQGEPRSAMALMATNRHSILKINPEDTVVISARQIPGNEQAIGQMIDNLLRREAIVIHENNADIHVSGHGAYEDLKLMLSLVRPNCFVPLHGEYRHLIEHAKLAELTGVPPQNIIVAENGDRVRLNLVDCYLDGQVPAGAVFIDGKTESTSDIVLHDRRLLSSDGIVVPVVHLDRQGQLVSPVDLVTRGFVHLDVSEDLIIESKQIVTQLIQDLDDTIKNQPEKIQEQIRLVLRRFLKNQTGKIPIILSSISQPSSTENKLLDFSESENQTREKSQNSEI
ncbi:ribonuclease J [Candidatus Poribacteria bacterium]|nr:ribonuclease J [Candidatus Poribacteria bacterium]